MCVCVPAKAQMVEEVLWRTQPFRVFATSSFLSLILTYLTWQSYADRSISSVPFAAQPPHETGSVLFIDGIEMRTLRLEPPCLQSFLYLESLGSCGQVLKLQRSRHFEGKQSRSISSLFSRAFSEWVELQDVAGLRSVFQLLLSLNNSAGSCIAKLTFQQPHLTERWVAWITVFRARSVHGPRWSARVRVLAMPKTCAFGGGQFAVFTSCITGIAEHNNLHQQNQVDSEFI